MLAPASLRANTLDPAGLFDIDDKSPPSAPKAPPMAWKRADPFSCSEAYLTTSSTDCDNTMLLLSNVQKINVNNVIFFISLFFNFSKTLLSLTLIYLLLEEPDELLEELLEVDLVELLGADLLKLEFEEEEELL